jgi:hypothetical protein
VLTQLREGQDGAPPPSTREFVSGETFLYLGRQYRLRVAEGRVGRTQFTLVGRWFNVPVLEGGPGPVRDALVAWYVAHAARYLPEKASAWAKKMGIPTPRVVVKEQQKRWGSCDAAGTVRFNWRIIQSPIRLVDYVVAHELVHLEHPDHTEDFWTALGKVMLGRGSGLRRRRGA